MSINNRVYYVFEQILSFFKEEDFLRKMRVTLGMICLYRFLCYIPVPGLDLEIIDQAFSRELKLPYFLDLFMGNIKGGSILSIGISSYINCSLFFNLSHLVSDYFKELKKDAAGRSILNSYTRYASFIHAFCFAYAGSYYLKSLLPNLVLFPSKYFHISTALFVATGAMITVWIADQISLRGIGNGSSIIIFINIIHSLPYAIFDLYKNLNTNVLSYKIFLLFLLTFLGLLFVIVYCEKVYREYKVLNIGKKNMLFNMLPDNALLMKLNPAGIMPAIWISQMMGVHSFIKTYWDYTQYYYGALFEDSFNASGYMFILIRALMLFATSYTFAEMLFNPEEKANEFKSKTMIPGVRPGEDTKRFLENKLFYISMIGGCYLVFVCCAPSLLHVYLKNSGASQLVVDLFNIQGVSLVIVAGVVSDFIDKIFAGIKYKLSELTFKSMTYKLR